MIDVAALMAAIYRRLHDDAAGAATRALLGDGAASVIPAHALRAGSLPPRPFLVLRGGPVPGDRALWLPVVYWWSYDDPQQGYRRLNSLIKPLALAYDQTVNRLTATGCPIAAINVEADADENYDTQLGLNVRRIKLSIVT